MFVGRIRDIGYMGQFGKAKGGVLVLVTIMSDGCIHCIGTLIPRDNMVTCLETVILVAHVI